MDYKKEIKKQLDILKSLNKDRRTIEIDLNYGEFYLDQALSKGGNGRLYKALKNYIKNIEKDNIGLNNKTEKPIVVDISESEILTMLIQVRAEVDVLTKYVIDLMVSRPGASSDKKIWEKFFSDRKNDIATLTKTIAQDGEQETGEPSS